MRFSLQQMVRAATEEADRRTKLAEAEAAGTKEGEGEKDKDKRPPQTPPSNKATEPERNETSIDVDKDKTSSAFVEKLASAVEWLNNNFLKEAEETSMGAGTGPNTMETNLKSPPGGGQKQSERFGQAKTGVPPQHPGPDAKDAGRVNPATTLESTMKTPPGGKEDWTHTDKMKQSAARLRAALQKMAEGPGEKAEEKAEKVVEEHEKKETPAQEKKEEAKEEKKEASVARIFSILKKTAGEDVSAAHISAAHRDNPPDSSKSEEGVPSQPGEVSKQKSMIASNQAAINYTKQQAKAVPKARMGEVIDEPAQKKSTDPVLHENLDAAGKAGVKLSSAKLAAARSLLQKIAEEGAKPDASPEEKERAAKLQAALEAKKKDKEKQSQAAAQEPTSPIGGGY